MSQHRFGDTCGAHYSPDEVLKRDNGVDLSSLSELGGDELIEALRELSVDIDAANGDTVRVFCD
ncbi:MAG: hypothetical protein JSV80_18315 [Acidobacteriota bacterium]|nr:MAG: hypothetical protein JSV80_18315 [Acidobacteriota bacterium]